MIFVTDENFPSLGHRALNSIYGHVHKFHKSTDFAPRGTKDPELFRVCAEQGVDVIVTGDLKHLRDPHELRTLHDCGLHWVGVPSTRHLRGGMVPRTQVAAVLYAFKMLAKELQNATEPTAFLLEPMKPIDYKEGYPQPLSHLLESARK